jgi:hypothetical protein
MIQTGVRKYHGDEANIFREHEKKYRLVIPTGMRLTRAIKLAKTDFSNVIDFVNINSNTEENKKLIREISIPNPTASEKFAPLTKAYTLESAPGTLTLLCQSMAMHIARDTTRSWEWLPSCIDKFCICRKCPGFG